MQQITDSKQMQKERQIQWKEDSKQVLGAIYQVRKAPKPKKKSDKKKEATAIG